MSNCRIYILTGIFVIIKIWDLEFLKSEVAFNLLLGMFFVGFSSSFVKKKKPRSYHVQSLYWTYFSAKYIKSQKIILYLDTKAPNRKNVLIY